MSHLFDNYNLLKVLNVFFDDPIKDFQLREIARKIKISHKSVSIYIKKLKHNELIKINRNTLYKSYNANIDNPNFQIYKKMINVVKIYESGLIEYLHEKLMPESIVLFGSFAKGIDTKDSDIDIFIERKEEKISLMEYEKKLNRKIHLIFEPNLNELHKELKNNIVNGIVLKGALMLFK